MNILVLLFSGILTLADPSPEVWCPEVKALAAQTLQGLPGGLPITGNQVQFSSLRKGLYGESRLDTSGNMTIVIYYQEIANDENFKKQLASHGGSCSPFMAGIVCKTVYHERLHACLVERHHVSFGSDACNDPFSCIHLAIDKTVSDKLCDKIGDLMGQQPPPTELIAGMCAGLCSIEKKWDTPSGRARLEECRSGAGPCPMPATNSCSIDGYPELPPPGSNDVMSHCRNCPSCP